MKNNDIEVIRQINTAMVLDTLRKSNGHMSRPVLADILGLSKVTVSTIVRSLNEKGLIADAGLGGTDSRGGRRPVLVTLDKEKKRVLGARVGHTSIDLILSDITGRELKRLRAESKDQNSHSILSAMVNDILVSTNTPRDAVLGLTVAMSGSSAPLSCGGSGEGNGPLVSELELCQTFGFPAMVINFTRARAFGEFWFAPERTVPDDFFFVNLGHHLDGVAARRGQLDESSCELGSCYLSVLPYGDKASELKTLDSVLGGRSLLAKATAIYNRAIDAAELEKMAASGEPRALELLHEFGYSLGCALSLIVNMVSLNKIIVGGQFSRTWKYFEAPMREGLQRHTQEPARDNIDVRLIRAELDSGLMGAMAMALDHWVFHTEMLYGGL